MQFVSNRIKAAANSNRRIHQFYFFSRYAGRRTEPGICDFTFGSPHEMPLPPLVEAIRRHAIPLNKDWFAYKTSEAEPQAFLAEHLTRELSLPFEPEDIALTNGAFAAISVAFRLLLDVGDEAIFSTPAWEAIRPPNDLPPITKLLRPNFLGRTASIIARKHASRALFESGTRRPCSVYRKLNLTTLIPRAASPIANLVMKSLF